MINDNGYIQVWDFTDIESAMHQIALYQADNKTYAYMCSFLTLVRKKFLKDVPLLYYSHQEESDEIWRVAKEIRNKMAEDMAGKV